MGARVGGCEGRPGPGEPGSGEEGEAPAVGTGTRGWGDVKHTLRRVSEYVFVGCHSAEEALSKMNFERQQH